MLQGLLDYRLESKFVSQVAGTEVSVGTD